MKSSSKNSKSSSKTNKGSSKTNKGSSKTNKGSSKTNKSSSKTNKSSSKTNKSLSKTSKGSSKTNKPQIETNNLLIGKSTAMSHVNPYTVPNRNYLRNSQSFHIAWATHFTSVAEVFKARYPQIFTDAAVLALQTESANFRETDKRRTNAETLMENLTQQRLALLYGDAGTLVTLEGKNMLPDLAPATNTTVYAGWVWRCVQMGDAVLALGNAPEGDIHELQLNPLPPVHHDAVPDADYYLEGDQPWVKWRKNGYKALAVQYTVADTQHWEGTLVVTGSPAPLNLPRGAKPITYQLRPIYLLHDQPHGQYGPVVLFTMPAA